MVALRKGMQAAFVVRLEQHRVQRHLVLPHDAPAHAEAAQHRQRPAQRRVQRGHLRGRAHRPREHAAVGVAELAPREGRERFQHVLRLGRGAHDGQHAVDLVHHMVPGRRARAQAPRPEAGPGLRHFHHHQRDRLRQVQAEALGTVARQRGLVLARRDQRAQQRRHLAALARLHALLRQQHDADDAGAALEGAQRHVAQLLAPKEQHRAQHIAAAQHRDHAAQLALRGIRHDGAARLPALAQRPRQRRAVRAVGRVGVGGGARVVGGAPAPDDLARLVEHQHAAVEQPRHRLAQRAERGALRQQGRQLLVRLGGALHVAHMPLQLAAGQVGVFERRRGLRERLGVVDGNRRMGGERAQDRHVDGRVRAVVAVGHEQQADHVVVAHQRRADERGHALVAERCRPAPGRARSGCRAGSRA
jgi:hypothetical protein